MLESKVFVLILNWNSSLECIRLYSQLLNYTNFKEIYVLDNNSALSEQEILAKAIPHGNYIQTGANLGYAGGNNIGIEMALKKGAEFVCILNPDVEIENNFIFPLIKKCISNPNIGVIGPRICYHDSKKKIYSDGGLVYPSKGYKTSHVNHLLNESNVKCTELNDVGYVNGSAMIIPVTSFKDVGFMRTDFFLYFEETEWCLRLRDSGKSIKVAPFEKVYHKSSLKGSVYNFYMNRNRIWLSKVRGEFLVKTIMSTVYPFLIQLIRFFIGRGDDAITKMKGMFYGVCTSPKKNIDYKC